MNKQNDVKYLNCDQYISLLAQGKISTKRQKTHQEIETEKLIQQCVSAVERGEKFC